MLSTHSSKAVMAGKRLEIELSVSMIFDKICWVAVEMDSSIAVKGLAAAKGDHEGGKV